MIIDTVNSNRQFLPLICTTCGSTVYLPMTGYTNYGECPCGEVEPHAEFDASELQQHYGPFSSGPHEHDYEDEMDY